MPIAVRELTVLGEFKPFGLIAEALDGKIPDNNYTDSKYDYFLFNPELVGDKEEIDCLTSLGNHSDHELFVRGHKIIWSTGARVFKRFTLPSPVIMACWCRLGVNSEVMLCILHIDSLSIHNISGEVVSIPLPCAITSIWALPFGLLLQSPSEGNSLQHVTFSRSSPIIGARDVFRRKRDIGQTPPHDTFSTTSDHVIKGDCTISSHLILKDLLEEPQFTHTEERGKLSIMKDFDERTIWTSDQIPLMASYNKGKMQHSLWVVEFINSNHDMTNLSSIDAVPDGISAKQFSFRRIWQGKGAQTTACKVFIATDDDASPVVCFLLQEQKNLLSIRLQSLEINNEIVFDIKPDMCWTIPAVGAAPIIVTRPGANVGFLPYTDIIILAPDSTLFLYSGKQCLCKYSLPSCLGKTLSHDSKIVGLADSVEGRVNLIMNSGQMFRCVLRRSPSSSLVNDCITALSEGLSSRFYTDFLVRLWGESDSDYLSVADASVDTEWDSFSKVILGMCKMLYSTSQKHIASSPLSSWQFLVNSDFHKRYNRLDTITKISSQMLLDVAQLDSSKLCCTEGKGSSESAYYFELLGKSLDSLHALYESLKLDNLRKRDLEHLAVLLCNISMYLGEANFLDHYFRDFPALSNKFGRCMPFSSQRKPPNIFRWLEKCLQSGCCTANANDLPPLVFKDGSSVANRSRKIISFYSLLCGGEVRGKNLSSGVYCNIALGSYCTSEELTVLAMVGEKFGAQQLDSLPSGVSLPLLHALDKCRDSPPTDWPPAAYVLLGRDDLSALSCFPHSSPWNAQTDVNLFSMSAPYMLHLHPVTVPSTASDAIRSETSKYDEADSANGSLNDGMEHIFNSSTQLRYGKDLRLNEVRNLLCSAKAVAIQTSANPSASDQEIQQAQLWQLAQRTTALPFGRGAFTLATISTLLTEAFTVPKLVLAGRLPAQQNATVNLDPNIRNMHELISWPEFHNAVAAGLRLAPVQGKVSRTWIIYNKPEEPNVVHAGLLLALGLHGYLRVLVITDIYTYFTQEHESTTVGLMLGLAASYRGTMQPAISKCLYVHIPSRHSCMFPELELPTLLQSAALVSVGLLYEGSVHPQTMQILLSEIGRKSGGDNVLEREGYAVSAGFALGLVALGRGEDALGSMNSLVDRLFHYIGGKEIHHEKSAILMATPDKHNRGVGQMIDGTTINIDVTAPGAIIALALMFLKTESWAIVSKLSIPQTQFDLQYVRPDFIMLRVIARSLIMWNSVHPSKEWIQSQIPEIVKKVTEGLGDDNCDIDETDIGTFVLAYVNIVAGACVSIGLRFAGTRDRNAQELLYGFSVYFLNEIKPVSAISGDSFPRGLSNYVDRGTLEICLHLVVLSLSVVMSGTGHLQTFRLLRFLRGRNSIDGHANYGIQMMVSLSIGFLFLGGGRQTFSTSNTAISALLITLYPRLPTGPNDNRCHLQAFRHLYVLATEARWVQTIDVDTGLPVYAPLEVTIRETEHYSETRFSEVTPCILPERAILKSVRVCGPRYWPYVIELVPEDKPWWSCENKNNPFNSGVLFIKRKVGACSYVDDPTGCQSLLSRAMHKVFGLTSMKGCGPCNNGSSVDGSFTVDQLVSIYSSDPSLIAFARFCCDPARIGWSGSDFQEFCLQVLFECITKDTAALLQVYLSLYTTIASLGDQVANGTLVVGDSLSISSLKLAITYNEALLSGRLTSSKGSIVQSMFLGSIRKRVEELFIFSEGLEDDLRYYLETGKFPGDKRQGYQDLIPFSCYLQWFGVPAPTVTKSAVDRLKNRVSQSSSIPLLRLLLPNTHINAISMIDKFLFASEVI